MKKIEVVSKKGSKAVGPYSPAVLYGDLIFVSGQIGINPQTGSLVEGIKAQTKQALTNMQNTLDDSNSSLANVLKTTVYLSDMNDYLVVNEIYATFFAKPYPARAAIQVAKLPKGALIEIDCIAYVKDGGKNCCGGVCENC